MAIRDLRRIEVRFRREAVRFIRFGAGFVDCYGDGVCVSHSSRKNAREMRHPGEGSVGSFEGRRSASLLTLSDGDRDGW